MELNSSNFILNNGYINSEFQMKVSVTRSFSYTIGNLTGSRQHHQAKSNSGSINNTKPGASKDNLKARSSFSFNLTDALGLGKSASNVKSSNNKLAPNMVKETSSSFNNLTSKNFEKLDTYNKSNIEMANQANDDQRNQKSYLVKIDIKSDQLNSLTTPLYLLPDSSSSTDLQGGSSLLAFATSGKDELQNVYDFQHVSK